MSISVSLEIPTACVSALNDDFLEQFDSEFEAYRFMRFEIFDVNPDNYDLDPDNILVMNKVPHDVTIESSDLGESGDTSTLQVRFDARGNMMKNKFKGRQQSVNLDDLVAAYMTGDLHSLIQSEYGKIISWEDQLKIIESRKIAINEWLAATKDDIEQALASLVPEVYEGEDCRIENLLNLYAKSADEQASFLVLNGCYPGQTTPYEHRPTLPAPIYKTAIGSGSDSLEVEIEGCGSGLNIRLENHGVHQDDNSNPALIHLCKSDQSFKAFAYQNINIDEPTCELSFDNALERNRANNEDIKTIDVVLTEEINCIGTRTISYTLPESVWAKSLSDNDSDELETIDSIREHGDINDILKREIEFEECDVLEVYQRQIEA